MKKIIVLGSLNMDFVVTVETMPLAGQTITAKSIEYIPGGKGANQAYAAGRLGGDVTMLGSIGGDSNGNALADSLHSTGVNTAHLLTAKDTPTGVAAITVDANGENHIMVVPGANHMVTLEYLEQIKPVIASCDILMLQLEIPLETVTAAALYAKSLDKTVILDPAPPRGDLPEELLSCVDFAKPNETELEALTGIPVTRDTVRQACQVLLDRGVGCVLATLGSQGVYILNQNGEEYFLETIAVNAVDTTAAGDSFLAAFAVSMATGETLPNAATFANKVAAIVVTRKGAQSSIPTLEEVNRYHVN